MVKSTRLGYCLLQAVTSFNTLASILKLRSLRSSFTITICLLITLFFQPKTALGQNTNYCSGNCTSGDIRITQVEIINADPTKPLPTVCDEITNVPVKLKVTFTVISQTRYGFLVTADLYRDGVYAKSIADCAGGTFTKGPGKTFTFSDTVHWTCGQSIELRNVFTAWDNSAPSTRNPGICTRLINGQIGDCSLITPKCYFYGSAAENAIGIITPVQSEIKVEYGACTDNNGNPILYKPIIFSATGSGGTYPYSFSWIIKDAASGSTLATYTKANSDTSKYVYTPLNANSLRAELTVTDNSNPAKVKPYTKDPVSVQSCCTPPVIGTQQHPTDQQKCEGETATFMIGYTDGSVDGSPSTTIQWQEKIGSGNFSNISNSSSSTVVPNYSGSTSATLTITGVTFAMNNRQYRAVLTSGACDPATSSAATLKVDPASVGGATTATKPTICSGTGTSITLSGNTGAIQKWQYSTNGTDWSNIASTANPLSTGNLTTTTQFRAVVKSGVCSETNSAPVTVTVNEVSIGGTTAATRPTICAGTGTTITLTGNTGAIQKWQSSTNGTNWSDIASTDNPLSTGTLTITTQFRAVVKSGVCDAANSAPVTVSVDAPPTTASVGSLQERCGTLVSTSLGGNTPTIGTGTWSKKEGPGTVSFSAVNSGSSTATVSVPGNYVFTWTISNGTCPSSSSDITVKFYELPSTPGGNVTVPTCSNANGSVTITAPLDGNNTDYEYKNGSGNWTDDVVFTVAAGSNYSILVRNKATGCISASAYSGTMAAQPATPAQPAFSNTNATCSAGGSITITNYNTSYTYVLTGPSPATTTRTLTTATTQNIAAGNYTLTASLTTNAATCTSPAANITIGAAAGVPSTPVIGVKQNATCSSAAMIIEVTSPTPLNDYEFRNGVNGTWQTSSEFTIIAGTGYEIYARRKSDNTCVSDPQTCVPVQNTTVSQKSTIEAASVQTPKLADIHARVGSKTKVLATPNPFSDKVRFTLESEISGQGSLEIYNTMGQRITIVYQGYVEAGKSFVKEYQVPESHRANLIYVFRVGDQKTTGKLLNW